MNEFDSAFSGIDEGKELLKQFQSSFSFLENILNDIWKPLEVNNLMKELQT